MTPSANGYAARVEHCPFGPPARLILLGFYDTPTR